MCRYSNWISVYPIQITLIDLAIEGILLLLSFEQDKRKITYRYLPTALINAFANALLVVVNIIAVSTWKNIRMGKC